MTKKWFMGVALLAVLALPVAARAHGGHTHKALGTISAVNGVHVDIKTTGGKIITIMLDDKTAITRGKTKLDAAALKLGERVSVDYMPDQNMNMAKAVKLGTAAPASK